VFVIDAVQLIVCGFICTHVNGLSLITVELCGAAFCVRTSEGLDDLALI